MQTAQEQSRQEYEALAIERNELKEQYETLMMLQKKKNDRIGAFKQSDTYINIVRCAKSKAPMQEEDWHNLERNINEIYDYFAHRLFSLCRISDIELKICCLVKVGFTPIDIAHLLLRTPSAISAARKRLYEKLTGKAGDASDLDMFLKNM